ncbi:MAG: protease HtpX [Granulosicoccaceae bacterium]
MQRMMLFLGTNMAVMLVMTIMNQVFGIDRLFGLDGHMTRNLVFAAIFGFVGAFISLAMSKSVAKRSMGVKVIEEPANDTERWLKETVHKQAAESGIGLPEVGIFNSPTPNAFATGMNKNNALVAVSTGLLSVMDKGEVEAVLGHEVAHVYNGDMVTMGLIQGVLNTFVIFFSRILGSIISQAMRGNRLGYFIGSMVGNVLFGIFASFIAAWFSRQREYRADAGGAGLSSNQNMIGALKALQRIKEPAGLPSEMAAFGIAGGKFSALRSTHPPLEVRIAKLEEAMMRKD